VRTDQERGHRRREALVGVLLHHLVEQRTDLREFTEQAVLTLLEATSRTRVISATLGPSDHRGVMGLAAAAKRSRAHQIADASMT
jgi:hypothetical protein